MIKINFSKGSYWPGQEVVAEVFVSLDRPVKARGLYAALECTEKKHIKTTRYLDHYNYERQREMGIPISTHMSVSHSEVEHVVFSKEFQVKGEMEYHRENFSVKFSLPPNAAPTSHEFGHDSKMHIWKLKVRLDVPMAMDENGEAEIFVEGLGR